MQEMQVQSLGWEDPLEKEMATHSSFLCHGQRNLAAVQGVVESDMAQQLNNKGKKGFC